MFFREKYLNTGRGGYRCLLGRHLQIQAGADTGVYLGNTFKYRQGRIQVFIRETPTNTGRGGYRCLLGRHLQIQAGADTAVY